MTIVSTLTEDAGLCQDNLHVLSQMPHFNQWIWEHVQPYLGKEILEAGCGNARFTTQIVDQPQVRRYVGIDISPMYGPAIQTLAQTHPRVSISFKAMDIAGVDPALFSSSFDTIVCLNVLEHIIDDGALLKKFHSLLSPGGRLILQLPAFPWLFGSVDQAIGHHRRYTRPAIRGLLSRAGFSSERSTFFNTLGILAWIWHGKIRRLTVHPEGEMRFGDRLIPALKKMESALRPPFGLSLFVVARKV